MSVASSPSSVSTVVETPNRSRLKLYLELTKSRLSTLVVVTTAAGYALAVQGGIDWLVLLATVVGTGLAAGCANALNEIWEMKLDAKMHRTQRRPLPSGAMSPAHAFIFAVLIGYAGLSLLTVFVNLAAAGLALLTILLYVLVYTPMKVRSTLNTPVGAVCGAIPPMIGWVAATGRLDLGAWLLGALLFIWQLPHFLALAWLYREDYERGGYRMLANVDPTGRLVGMVATVSCLTLVPLAVAGAMVGLTGWFATLGLLLAGVWFWWRSVEFNLEQTDANARRLFRASLLYLPAVLALMVLDSGLSPLLATHP